MPFRHNHWGIVDTNQQEIVPPIYKTLRIIGDADFVQFDDSILIDLNTGKEVPSEGECVSAIRLEGGLYHLFNSDSNSVLIDLMNKDTILLSLKYKYMNNTDMIDPRTGKSTPYIHGHLSSGENLLLHGNKKLNSAIRGKFDEFEFLDSYGEIDGFLGIVIQKDGFSKVYDSHLALIQSTVINSEWLDILGDKQIATLKKKYKLEELYLACYYDCGGPDEDLSFYDQPDLPSIFLVEYPNDRLFVSYALPNGDKEGVRPSWIRGIPRSLKAIYFNDDENTIVFDPRFVKLNKVMFPKKYLE